MVGEETATPLPEARNRECGTCGRVLATEMSGILAPAKTTQTACDTCDEFESLYATIGPADQTFEALKHRTVKHVPRWNALKAAEKAHLALANFFLRVEADGATQIPKEPVATDQGQSGNIEQGIKRSRSSTSTSDTPSSSKKTRLGSGVKSIRFDDSVIVREESEYRGTGEFQRDTEVYVRGRNAASEGNEWIDSSGSSKTYGEFHGLKWRGRKWANDPKVNMDKMEDDDEESKPEAQPTKAGDDKNAIKQGGVDDAISHISEPTQTPSQDTDRDLSEEPQDEATKVVDETAEERTEGDASPNTPKARDELALPERPASG